MIELLTEITGGMSARLWGIPALVMLVGTGLFLTIKLLFIQLRGLKHGVAIATGSFDNPQDPGEVSHFQALSTALSATIGTGNIAGVAAAISLGGPGAVFWMWVTAMVGMATKYASCTLALRYREIDDYGRVAGGPMYTLKNGLNMKLLGGVFALFTLIASFGIGNMVQANSIIDGMSYVFPSSADYKLEMGIALAIAVALVILGGIGSIARVASKIVPIMAVTYCLAALIILAINYSEIPGAFLTIFYYAFNSDAAVGGTVGMAIQYGVARGVFSNEAGLGSSPIAHAAAATSEPVREGLVAMLEPLIDTLIICSMTALVVVISGYWGVDRPPELVGAALSAHAFSDTLGEAGAWIVGWGLVFFAYSTIIAWSYYGDRSAYYLFGEVAVLPYRMIYVLLVVVGATIPLNLVWNFADIANISMALPNLISLLLLAGTLKVMTDQYFQTRKP